jgi:hypothetical protein
MARIKSYTVIEMLVVMLISALSIGITYTCYMIFSNHYTQYKKNSDELAEYILADRLLTKDIASSRYVRKTIDGIVCEYKKEKIYYDFSENAVVRKSTIIDTFHIAMTGIPVCKYAGQEEHLPNALLEEVFIYSKHHDEPLEFYYRKLYGADLLMNIEEEKNN